MMGELAAAFVLRCQFALDLRARFHMTVEEFDELDVPTAYVAVHAIVRDQGTLTGAHLAGFAYPMSYPDLLEMSANVVTFNSLSGAEEKLEPHWPWDNSLSSGREESEDEALSEDELARLRAQLDAVSAIPRESL
jgi:hypothetical protein